MIKFIAFVYLIVSVGQAWSFDGVYRKWMPPVFDKSCKFTRVDALKCLSKYVDVAPKDGGITPKEAKLAIKRFSTPPIRALFWGLGTNQIWKACDFDKNGVITAKDWVMSKKTCMPHKRNMCSLKWFCERGKKLSAKYVKPPRIVKK